MEKYIIGIVLTSIIMSSCATIMNQSHKSITVYTTEPSKIICENDTVETVKNKAHLSVERRKEPLKIIAVTDSLTKSLEVESRNSFMFWSNLFNYGIGIFVDRKNPKRYSFPNRIYINSKDTISEYFRYGQSDNKGELCLHVSLPHINSFYLKPENERNKVNTGFWGATIGLDYYHSRDQFLSLNITAVTDLFVPVPAPISISGEYEIMSSRYISLSNNHRIKRFSYGYGISYARNTWNLSYSDSFDPPPPTRAPVRRRNSAFGLIFPNYFQLGESFNIGIVYRPSFYRFNLTDKFAYEHLISVDFAWKIRIKR